MKYDNQLRYAVKIINDYNGSAPLASWLKDFFKANKQMGSRDRKTVAAMVYSYYRLGYASFTNVEQRIVTGLFLTDSLPEVREYLSARIALQENISPELYLPQIFPWKDRFSDGIDANAFARSFLIQPNVFLRTRPGKKEIVLKKLSEAQMSYTPCGDVCIELPTGTGVDKVINLNNEAVIQDRNSQETSSLIDNRLIANDTLSVWDCCAASGGKSIMVHDLLKNIQLTVSDIRPTIIHNLQTRFKEAGIEGYISFVADLANADAILPDEKYDLIIADVPCSGSGTWSRTPEQLYFFKEQKIDHYAQLQKKIVSRVIPYLKKNGLLLYITCSVFRNENEDVVAHIESTGAQLIEKKLLAGYDKKADTLFAALFTNRSA